MSALARSWADPRLCPISWLIDLLKAAMSTVTTVKAYEAKYGPGLVMR
jgi:hypothetical protein